MSLLHRRSHDTPPAEEEAVAAPPAAPPPAEPPSPDEFDAVIALTALKDRLEDGTLSQAEYDTRRKELGFE